MLINNALLLFYTSRARIFRLHFVYTGEKERRSGIRDAYSSSGWVDDGGDATPGCCASRETLVRSNRGRTRVCIDEYARTHARTYTRVTSIEAWSTNYYVSLVPPTFFFFSFFLPFFSTHPLPSFVHPDGSYSLRFPYGRG